ncbi:peptide chain release factor N(5)-glutamine methyltransferase [Jatrophihabitans sp. DSM 45814]
MSSLSDQLKRATRQLADGGAVSPGPDAEILLAHVLGLQRGQLRASIARGDAITAAGAQDFAFAISQRKAGVPLQHILGSAPFRHLELLVGPGVFIPRPETELIVDLAHHQLSDASLVVDLCAGSGAIALAVANEFPSARVVAVERSTDASDWLRRNAQARADAGDRPIEIVTADVAAPDLLFDLAGKVDVVLSNPPYVPDLMRGSLSREVGHDPDAAVFAGNDGLGLMPAVALAAVRLLRPAGFVVIEHDESQGITLPALLRSDSRWSAVTDHLDLAGRPRFASAVRSAVTHRAALAERS